MKKKKDKETSAKEEGPGSEAQFTALSFDYEEYTPYLEDADLTEDQKREFLETLWNIMVSFVDLGFGIHPIQQAGGEEHPIENLQAMDAVDVVTSDYSSREKFKSTSDRPSSPSEKRNQK